MEHFLFFTYVNYINMILAIIALILVGFYISSKVNTSQVLPRGIKLYLVTCTIPYSIIVCIASIYLTIIFITSEDEQHDHIKIAKMILEFCTQQLRGGFILLICERTLSTVMLEKYVKLSSNGLLTFIIMTLCSYLMSVLYLIPSYFFIFETNTKHVYFITVYTVVIVHILTLIICKILHGRNKNLYKLLAYRVTLRQRSQIVENIKVLSFIFSDIFIFATVAPLGLIGTVTYNTITDNIAPTGLFLTTYNLAFIFIMTKDIKFMVIKYKKNVVTTTTQLETAVVVSPLGKPLPTIITSDNYFKGLQHQWK